MKFSREEIATVLMSLDFLLQNSSNQRAKPQLTKLRKQYHVYRDEDISNIKDKIEHLLIANTNP